MVSLAILGNGVGGETGSSEVPKSLVTILILGDNKSCS